MRPARPIIRVPISTALIGGGLMLIGCSGADVIFPFEEGERLPASSSSQGGATTTTNPSNVGGSPDTISTGIGAGGSGGAAGSADCSSDAAAAAIIASEGTELVRAMAIAHDGSIVIGGQFEGNIAISGTTVGSASKPTPFVARLEPDLQLKWFKQLGAEGIVNGIAMTDTLSIAVVGTVTGSQATLGTQTHPLDGDDGFLLVLDIVGNALWSQILTGPGDDKVRSIDSQAGHIVIGGHVAGDEQDAYIEKINSVNGDSVWRKTFDSPGFQTVHSVSIGAGNGIVFNGTTRGPIDVEGQLVAGNIDAMSDDAFSGRITEQGDILWVQAFEGLGHQRAFSLATSSNSSFHTGTFEGTVDFGGIDLTSQGATDVYLIRLSESGEALWGRSFGDEAIGSVRQVTSTSGEVILAGPTAGQMDIGCGPSGSPHGNPEGYATAFDADGTRLFSAIFSDGSDQPGHHQYGERALVRNHDDLLVLGHFRGSISIGGVVYGAVGQNDAFIALYEGVL